MIEPVQLPSPWRDARLTVVVPTYNEAGNLPALVERLLALPLPGLRILVADDNSPDGTGEVADKLAIEHPDRIEVVHRAGKEGLGRAYVDGMSGRSTAAPSTWRRWTPTCPTRRRRCRGCWARCSPPRPAW